MAQQDVKTAPIRKPEPAKWPPGVRAITADELEAIGVDHQGDLYWHGKHVQVRHPLVLNFWHSLLATGTALSAIALGLIEPYGSFSSWPRGDGA
jgi:hypothetical protein